MLIVGILYYWKNKGNHIIEGKRGNVSLYFAPIGWPRTAVSGTRVDLIQDVNVWKNRKLQALRPMQICVYDAYISIFVYISI